MIFYIGKLISYFGLLFNQYVSSVLAIVFPFDQSFKALNTEDRIDDDIQVLTFWIIFGFWNCIEFYMEWLVRWIPMYYWFKTIALIWLIFPIEKFGVNIGGAHICYKYFLETFLPKYEPIIDKYLKMAGITFKTTEEIENERKERILQKNLVLKGKEEEEEEEEEIKAEEEEEEADSKPEEEVKEELPIPEEPMKIPEELGEVRESVEELAAVEESPIVTGIGEPFQEDPKEPEEVPEEEKEESSVEELKFDF